MYSGYNVDEDEEWLDLDLLDQTLDTIFNDEGSPENKTNDKLDTLNENKKLVQMISDLYHLTNWNSSEDRPEGCLMCYSLVCEHVGVKTEKIDPGVIFELAYAKCDHEKTDLAVDEKRFLDIDLCSKCIHESCELIGKNISTEIDDSIDLRVIWDEMDLMQYFAWISKIENKLILQN